MWNKVRRRRIARVNNPRLRLEQFTLESERDLISDLAIERAYSKAMHHLASVAATILISSLMYLPRPTHVSDAAIRKRPPPSPLI
jgi:hypothetical protein